jgi:hypothetical protein
MWNIFPKGDLRSASPYKNSSNLSFLSFHKGTHDASTKDIEIFSPRQFMGETENIFSPLF